MRSSEIVPAVGGGGGGGEGGAIFLDPPRFQSFSFKLIKLGVNPGV